MPAERRAWERHPCAGQASLHPAAVRGLASLAAQFHDLSAGGAGLLLAVPPLVGPLALTLPGLARPVPARVAHLTPRGAGWLLGCAFETPLSDAELQAALAAC